MLGVLLEASSTPCSLFPSKSTLLGCCLLHIISSREEGQWVPEKGPWAPLSHFSCRPHALPAKEERRVLFGSSHFLLARAAFRLCAAILNLTSMSAWRRFGVSFPLSPLLPLDFFSFFRHSWLMSCPMVKCWRWHISVLWFSVLTEWPTPGMPCERADDLRCRLA